jgi:hypothetical protein
MSYKRFICRIREYELWTDGQGYKIVLPGEKVDNWYLSKDELCEDFKFARSAIELYESGRGMGEMAKVEEWL